MHMHWTTSHEDWAKTCKAIVRACLPEADKAEFIAEVEGEFGVAGWARRYPSTEALRDDLRKFGR